MRDLFNLLFESKGKVGRLAYGIVSVIIFLFNMSISVLLFINSTILFERMDAFLWLFILGFALSLLTLFIKINVMGKRLVELRMNKGLRWLLFTTIIPVLNLAFLVFDIYLIFAKEPEY